MARTDAEIANIMAQDTSVGLVVHYKPMEQFINERGYTTGIELGTAYGGLANHLLERTNLTKLITVDPFKFYPDMPGLFDQHDYDRVKANTQARLAVYGHRCEMVELNTQEAYVYLQGKVDFVFIDALHTYDAVKWECEHYKNLIVPGGALMGHDYNIFEGVNKAVDEFGGDKVKFLDGNIWYINYSDL